MLAHIHMTQVSADRVAAARHRADVARLRRIATASQRSGREPNPAGGSGRTSSLAANASSRSAPADRSEVHRFRAPQGTTVDRQDRKDRKAA